VDKNTQDETPPEFPIEETSQTALARSIAFGRRTFASFGIRFYGIYFGAFLCQTSAMNMQYLVRSLLVYRISDSAATVGLMSLAYALPLLLISYIGGSFADRFPRRNIIIAGQTIGAVMALVLAVALTTGYLGPDQADSWWLLMVAAVIQGVVVAISSPAQQAYVAELVGKPKMQNAVALNNMGMNGMRLIAPAIAGFVVEYLGFAAIYYLTAGIYILGVSLLLSLPNLKATVQRGGSALESLVEGARFLIRDRRLVLILSVVLITFVLGMPYFGMLAVFADDVLGVGAAGMGLLLTASGVGAVSGSLIMAARKPKRRGRVLLLTTCAVAAAIITFAFSNSWYLSLAMMVCIGLGTSVFTTYSNGLLLYYTPPEYHGRVMSLFMMQVGFISLGAAFAGMLADTIGVQLAVGGMAIMLAVLSVIWFGAARSVRQLD
jgi:MFS family permease